MSVIWPLYSDLKKFVTSFNFFLFRSAEDRRIRSQVLWRGRYFPPSPQKLASTFRLYSTPFLQNKVLQNQYTRLNTLNTLFFSCKNSLVLREKYIELRENQPKTKKIEERNNLCTGKLISTFKNGLSGYRLVILGFLE